MLLDDAALGVEDKGSGKRRDSAVLDAEFRGSDADGIVDAELFDELMDGVHVVIVHDEADDLEAVFVARLQIDEIGNFGAAGSAPGSPEIKQNDFAAGVGERNRLSVQTGELKVGRGVGIANEVDGGLLLLRCVLGLSRSAARHIQKREERRKGERSPIGLSRGFAAGSEFHGVFSRKAYGM